MYNITVLGNNVKETAEAFGEKYSVTDDLTQTNVIIADPNKAGDSGLALTDADLDSKLIFAAAGVPAEFCSDRGIVVFGGCSNASQNQVQNIRDFIENGNIEGSENFPDVTLGSFGNDISRIAILMRGIDDPILLAAMMFSGMNIRAIAGGLKGEYGYALVASREPVTRVPHVDGVLKVRVLQDI